MSEKKLKPMLAERYLQKHKNEVGTDNFTEGILRAIDIGYSKSDAPPNWYDDAVCADDGGKILLWGGFTAVASRASLLRQCVLLRARA